MSTDIARPANANIDISPQPATPRPPPTPCGPRDSYARDSYHLPARICNVPTSAPSPTLQAVSERTNRTKDIKLRVSPAEKALIEERAGGPQKVSAYLRELGFHGKLPSAKPAAAKEPGHTASEHQTEIPDFEQRVKEAERRMPRRSAEALVRREDARERAKGAIG